MNFNYLSGIFGIRSDGNVPFISNNLKIEKPIHNIHIDVLKYCYDYGYTTALVYENEISLTRDLEDIENNEIRTFMMSNNDWDILIIGLNDIPFTSLVNGYTRVFKVNDNSTFYSEYAYIASRRFMQKAKTGNMNALNTYLYAPTFFKNIGNEAKSNIHIVGAATNVIIADKIKAKYTWHPVNLV
jgi:hypothetical protein